MLRLPIRKYVAASVFAIGATVLVVVSATGAGTPASAQVSVFDAGNYAQNVLAAARALQQINNQIRSLQNEAQMLTNQARNLTRIDFPQLQQLTQALQQIDRLMGQAQGIQFKLSTVDQQFEQLFPHSFSQALTQDQQVVAARARLDTSMDGFRHTMSVQAGVVENVAADGQALADIVSKSQGAEGSLQAQQATNQLLALTAKQQFQIQNLLAAQFRSGAIEDARRVQAEQDAKASTRKFLGTGHAYTPQ